jgi:thiol-disulfide isomerase/thioredoxin
MVSWNGILEMDKKMDKNCYRGFARLFLAIAFVFLSPTKGEAINSSGDVDLQNVFLRLGISTVQESKPLEGTVLDLRGEKKDLSSLRGKVTFLTFWTTWCPSCKVEMPALQKLYARYQDQGFQVLAVNIEESAATVTKYFKMNGLTYNSFLDPRGQLARRLGAWSVPNTLIIDRQGIVLGKVVGARDWDSPEGHKLLELLLTNH